MANWSDPRATAAPAGIAGARGVATDAGLRSYMLSVYNMMASGVLLTGIVALLFVNSGYAEAAFASPLRWVIGLAPLGFIFLFRGDASASALQTRFWIFAVLMGLSISTIFFRYTGPSIATTFAATSAAFAGLSLYGYTTKRDLGPLGTFLMMGLVGLIVAMVLNLGIAVFTGAPSSALHYAISFIGVLLFAGLTAYDTQKIKSMYFYVQGSDVVGKSVIMGALTLYLDFINMFTFLLQFMGDRR